MAVRFDKQSLLAWASKAKLADTKYHRTRKILWGNLVHLVVNGSFEGEVYKMDAEMFTAIKSGLTARSETMTDASRLALETALTTIIDESSDGEGLVVVEEEEEKKERPKKEG
jgi:hypothetical protein